MAANIEEKYSFWDFKGADPYIDDIFMMRTPFLMLSIVASYLTFVLWLGPKFMKNRPPYKLRNILLLYNAIQVAASFYAFVWGIVGYSKYGLIENGYCFFEKYPENKYELYDGYYFYMLIKLSELLETVFFVLRKKSNQISFLHTYHHTIMVVAPWFCFKYEPTYSLSNLGVLNSIVHVIMYSYYGLSAFPKLTKYLWWKKYITKLQLIQFVILIIQIMWSAHVSTCPTTFILRSVAIGNLLLMVILFMKFYIKSYMQKGSKTTEAAKMETRNGMKEK